MHPSKEIIDSWPAPNFKNPVTRGSALTVVNVIFITLVVITVAARYYTRLRITRSFGVDDWVIGLSLIPTFALTVVVLVADNDFGWNRHSWDLHPEKGPPGYKLCITAQILFFWAATLNKISLLCFYKRLTGPCTPLWYKLCIGGGIIFQLMMVMAYFIVALLACRPLKAFWEPLATYPYTCIDEGKLMLSFSVITIFLDFVILLLPIPIVWTLQLSKKQRLAVIALFGAGIIVCIAGIVHAYFVDVALVKSYDETWTGWPLWICSAVEVDLGILCVSVPAIRPLLAIYFPRLLESSHPPARPIKEWPDCNELGDQSGSSGNNSIPREDGKHVTKGEARGHVRDLESGSRDHIEVGNTKHPMEYSEVPKPER